MNVQKLLREIRLVPVAVIESVEQAVPLAEALLRGGLSVIEVTFRTPAAAAAIHAIVEKCPRMTVGAGTILTPEQLEKAIVSGAQFGVAPGFDRELAALAKAKGWPFIPGISTATELTAAIRSGCEIVKFFPAEAAGGPEMLRSLCAAFKHTGIQVMPTGGVSAANLSQWLSIPEVAAAGGSWMVSPKLISAGAWDEIEKQTAEAVCCIRIAGA